MKQELKDLLIAYADQYETAAFLDGDPSWFMHQVTGADNQEAMAFIASCLSLSSSGAKAIPTTGCDQASLRHILPKATTDVSIAFILTTP